MPGPQQGPTGVIVVTPFGQTPGGFFTIVDVNWDATGCAILDGTCPAFVNALAGPPPNFVYANTLNGAVGANPPQGAPLGNVSAGVRIFDSSGPNAGINLVASSSNGLDRGAIINPAFAQSNGIFYWEITWTTLASNAGHLGFGVCQVNAIDDYGSLAINGAGGVIMHADGTVYINGQPANPLVPNFAWLPPQSAGDAIGILINTVDASHWGVNFYGLAGGVANHSAGVFLFPTGSLMVPFVVFDGAAGNNSMTALFSQRNQGAFLASQADPMSVVGQAVAGLTLGWPAINIPHP